MCFSVVWVEKKIPTYWPIFFQTCYSKRTFFVGGGGAWALVLKECWWSWLYFCPDECDTTSTLHIFSSPEPKAHWWAYRIGRPPSSVCLSSTLFKHLLLRNHWADWSQISYGVSVGWGEWKFVQTVLVTWPRWPPCPYMVKTLKKSSSPEPKGRWPWNLVCSIRCSSTTKIVQMMTLGWPWPILRQGQIWSLMLLYGKKIKLWIFQKLLSSMIWN